MKQKITKIELPGIETLFRIGEIITVKGKQLKIESFDNDSMAVRLVGMREVAPMQTRAERRAAKRESLKELLRRKQEATKR